VQVFRDVLILVALAFATTASARPDGRWKDFYGEMQSTPIPIDAQALINDAQGCQHFGGEDPYDAERARQINAAFRQLRCATLDARHRHILKKYRANRLITGRIVRVWQASGLD
jgi:hypothetical protein